MMQFLMTNVFQAMAAGAAEVLRNGALLDRINVFPVMDGDTGTNMATSLGGLTHHAMMGASIDETIAALLRAASGNSGIISAQFIAGFLNALKSTPDYQFSDFKTAVAAGKDRAYGSVMFPKEGTMLSVMTEFSDALNAHHGSFDLAAQRLLSERLLQCVIQTQEMLPKLKAAEVVDSGALGFYLFAACLSLAAVDKDREGALRRIADIQDGTVGISIAEIHNVVAPSFINDARTDSNEKRFCINLLIEGDDEADPATVFQGIGDSANIAREGKLIKLHIHADDVDMVQGRAETLGKILDLKIQDMRSALIRRAASNKAEKKLPHLRYRVVTDSAVSLDRQIAAQHGILRVDNHIHIFGKKVADRDVNLEELFLGMRAGHSFKTAQVIPEDAVDFLNQAIDCSAHVIYIGVGTAYTGTQTSVRIAAQSQEPNRVTLLDSRAASGQLGLICLATQRFAQTVDQVDEVVAYAEKQIATCKEYLLIDDLKYLTQSGRIGRIKAGFASFLSLKPIVGHGMAGAITVAKVRSTEAAAHNIILRVANHSGEGPLLVMVEYTDNRPFAETLKAQLAEALPNDTEIILSPLSSSSAVHMGPGTFGVAVTRM